jgi:Gamma-glutamyl cyclotransferase, AIG2-like
MMASRPNGPVLDARLTAEGEHVRRMTTRAVSSGPRRPDCATMPSVTGPAQYVFGYGSLAAQRRAEGFVAELPGYTRGWGVAMDNACDLPGYKWYADAGGGRPAVFVAFLDIVESPGGAVNGLCLPVTGAELPALDARERNYDRIDVSERIGSGGRVWAYVGSVAGRERLRRGRAAGTAVIARGYLDGVRAAFQALGPRVWAGCEPSLDPGGLPVVALTRHELQCPDAPQDS